MDQQAQAFYEFLGFQLDVEERVLTRNGKLISLTPKAFDVLLFLVQNRGRILEKNELMKALWPESFVEEGNLSHNIFVLRKILGDDQNGKCFIQTIPRRGYKFVAAVRQSDNRELHNETGDKDGVTLSADYWRGRTPFRSLQAFEPEDAWLFFGRGSDTDELLLRLRRAPVLVIVGSSGSGKSSLVQAGLIPAVRQGRFQAEGTSSECWRIAMFRPSVSPFDNLAEVLPDALAPQLTLKEQAEFTEDLRSKLPLGGNSLRNAIDELARAAVPEEHSRVLFVVDQFEEIFTLSPDNQTRKCYIDALLAASSPDNVLPVHLILVLRSDFYANCLEYPMLGSCLETNLYNVQRMTTGHLRETIEKRLALASAQAEPGLVDSMLDDVGTEPGNLALLEHALGQLWEKRGGFGSTLTNAAYSGIGRLRGALRAHADNVYREITDEAQKRLVQKIFMELVQLGEGAPDTRRRVQKGALLSLAAPEQVEQLLVRLTSARLISVSGEGRKAFVEISHETLIREWATLNEWILENREEIQLGRKLVQAAQEWEELNQDSEALLQGARLSRAEEWLVRHEDAPAHVREYLLAGTAARSESVRRGRLSQAREHAERTALDARLGWIFGAVAFIAVIIMDALWVAYHPEWAAGRHLRDQVLTSFKREPWEVVLWLAAIPLQVAAYWVVIRRRFYRTWKALTWYLVFEIAESVVLKPLFLLSHRSPAYFFGYYVFGIAETIFRCLLVLEILIKVLNPFEALSGRRIAWFCFWAVQGISVVIAFSANQPAGNTWYSWISIVGTTILMANGGLLAIMLFQARELGIPWKSPVVEIALGLILYSAVETVNRLLFYGYGNRALNPAASVAYLIMLMGWIWTMLYRDPYLTAPLSFAKKRPG
jgi:DNA-binding winged helix-turn-helix (wHTH) protein/energy-coupling factor transporter ATP-binding protein EcfA2